TGVQTCALPIFGATSNFSSNAAVVRVITFQFARIAVSFEIEVVRVLFSSSLIRWFLPLVTHNLVRHGIYADLMCSSDKGRSPRRLRGWGIRGDGSICGRFMGVTRRRAERPRR